MKKVYYLSKSPKKNKKLRVVTPNDKKIDFGQKGASDYIQHKDKKRRNRYIARHSQIKKKDGTLAINDINSPAFWSLYILWGPYTDILKNIDHIEKTFNVKIRIV
jgi:hypothetical protein